MQILRLTLDRQTEREREITDRETNTGKTSNDSAQKSSPQDACSRPAGPEIPVPFEEIKASLPSTQASAPLTLRGESPALN
jgi:hypothetical protein